MNTDQEKLFAIGDIHGCYEQLKVLLERIPYRPERDTLIFMGDLINRGKDSYHVIELVSELNSKGRVICLLGNHEHLLLEYQSSLDPDLIPFLREAGIEATLESYGKNNLSRLQDLSFMPPEHRRILQSLEPYWETDSYIFVHAGIVPGTPLAELSMEQLTGMRDFLQVRDSQLTKEVIFGHTSFLTPFVSEKKIGIDTGAVYENMLTAVELPSRVFYHA